MTVEIKKLLSKENVVFLNTQDMESTIEVLSEKAEEIGCISSKDEFKEAILEREGLVSTGIGFGIAMPHAKLENISEFFMIIGINKKGIDWDAIDRKPVVAVFLIGGPSNQQKKYLQIIAKLMLLIKNSERREKLLNAKEEKEIVEIFQDF
ncbi:PTS system IIA component (Fru family) [Hypnocyclicus thermotrophus]|uniref:PTS system IIA component (Fru family) n=1 Tax=Hypnocyclicus thermotrophus TaxID=1627895 RepID=A0AA46DYB9_9FUSO|nr:PTS sugar transporter subunit IIA [Hypnocyclicus thermotrophus]TDT69848.1 PTS system IIA component (Fru family) [Hypnocyclicus thermotrophus]